MAKEKIESRPKQAVIESLATKYRPQVLADLVGQDAVVQQLATFVKSGRWPNAILISGDSGCGKTTTARMIARYLNCSNPDKDGTPCGECPSCSYGKDHPDYVERNVADTRGIDDIRAVIQTARSAPVIGNKRVLLLDEFHAATPQAQEALLVPLENPQRNTLWILATTNPEKLKPTIRGRCRILSLRRIDPEPMTKRLNRIAKLERFDYKQVDGWDKVVKYVCQLSQGQLRDAVELLDVAMGAYIANPKASYKEVLTSVLSTPEAELDKCAADLVLAVFSKNVKAAFVAVKASQNPRALLHKTRWLLEFLIDRVCESAKFTPYSGKLFLAALKEHNDKASDKVKISLLRAAALQQSLLLLEQRLNSMSIDETTAMRAALAEFMTS